MRMKKHLGSTCALIIGVLSMASGIAKPGSLLISGLIITLGALAYRSAKKRWLSEATQSLLRKSLEAIGIIAIVAVVLLQNNLKALIASEPISNLVIPLWAITAYLVVAFKKSKSN